MLEKFVHVTDKNRISSNVVHGILDICQLVYFIMSSSKKYAPKYMIDLACKLKRSVYVWLVLFMYSLQLFTEIPVSVF